ncbi:hypothetical protein [Bacillus stercoris]|uniref:hypothetical protein n=1 Tax=Bacillus stercoris TaxID=2054641 RepID=UPI003CEA4BE9
MGWAIIAVLIIISTCIFFQFFYDCGEAGILIGVISSFAFILLTSILFDAVFEKEMRTDENIKMYALKDNVGTDGNMFLGSGRVEDEIRYYYLSKEEQGFRIKKIEANSDDIYIKETKGSPHIEVRNSHFKNKILEHWFPASYSSEYVVYVPKNSIDYNFNIDLE